MTLVAVSIVLALLFSLFSLLSLPNLVFCEYFYSLSFCPLLRFMQQQIAAAAAAAARPTLSPLASVLSRNTQSTVSGQKQLKNQTESTFTDVRIRSHLLQFHYFCSLLSLLSNLHETKEADEQQQHQES